jgi:hypothetical protein
VAFLSNPPHVVQVQNMRRQQAIRGTYEDVPDGPLIAVPCSVQSVREWSTAEEIKVDGLQLLTLVRVFARSWPGDARSLVQYDGWVWETVGDPQHFRMSARTEHWAVTLKRRERI